MIRKQYEPVKTELIKCSQKDMIERNGYVSIEQSYNMFINAGRAQMEYLKSMYPQNKVNEINEKNLEGEEDLQAVAKATRNEDLDAIDYNRNVQQSINSLQNNLAQLNESKIALENELNNLKNNMNNNVNNNTDNVN